MEGRKPELELCIVRFIRYKFSGIYTVLRFAHAMLSTRKNIKQYLSRDTETESGNIVKPGVPISL